MYYTKIKKIKAHIAKYQTYQLRFHPSWAFDRTLIPLEEIEKPRINIISSITIK